MRDPALRPSNWRSNRSLEDELDAQGVVGICDLDTRALTRHLRERGAMRVGIFSGDAASAPRERLLTQVIDSPPMAGASLAEQVATDTAYVVPAVGDKRFTVAAVDLGIKAMTPQMMAERGIEVHVLPATATIDDVRAVEPDGVFFSNGPGDPATAQVQAELLREVLADGTPYFGICFGNQILGKALGFGTYKLKYGHRGINQPVMDRTTGKVEVTAHNHGFAVDAPLDRDAETPFGRRRSATSASTTTSSRASRSPRRCRRLLGAVPPRGRGRTARRRLPLRPLRRAHARSPAAMRPAAQSSHTGGR